MTGPGPGALSMFGETYEPADPPATDRCPACHGPSTNGRTCQRCRAAGVEAPRLDLAAPIGPAPTVRTVDTDTRLAEAAAQVAALRGGMDACNACDAAPADPDDPAGYCAECRADARARTLAVWCPGCGRLRPEHDHMGPQYAYCACPALTPDALAYWPHPAP